MILAVKNLSIVTSEKPEIFICNNLNFTVNKGETLGILGESGSGKSITSLSILKLLPAGLKIKSGEIVYTKSNEETVNIPLLNSGQLERIRGKEISMIFQEPMSSLNPVITCGDQVAEILIEHMGNTKEQAEIHTLELFAKVKLPDPHRIFKSYPHQLSGGQKQRVMIAMAIACKPQILIADEPTTALDVSVQKSILDLLKELQAEMGMSILFITHDISVVAAISHKIIVMNKGEIVESGEVQQILHNPRHPYTKALMECRFSIRNRGERLKTIDNIMSETPVVVEKQRVEKLETTSTAVFEISNLEVSFVLPKKSVFQKTRTNTVLRNINLSVQQGETLGLVGESGSGKTTLGRTMLRLIDSPTGNILFHGHPIATMTSSQLKEFRRKVQIIFQDPYSSLNPKLSIGDAIREPMEVHGLYKNSAERKAKVLELLRVVNLKEEYYTRYPHQFSGGQRQRIGIARALALQPELIVLDESVAALDVSIQAQVLNLLNDLKKEFNLTYIFISHDLNTVRYMSDRMVVLKDGQIVEEGPADVLFENPQSEYTRNLMQSIPGF
ncbi:MAG TPA: ABC transporter ATP-binding protein [Bacteroidales bacterium]|nr:ABC transporter ATP-binding protein [Bacteroidales bacterium]